VDGSWSDAQLAAFLMAAAVHELDSEETESLTRAMMESGTQWDLCSDFRTVGDKHSTGGVGDKVSLVLSPILAACDQPVVMLTGRGLGHTGGTADKLETIPGMDLELDRERCCRLLDSCRMAIGLATGEIAPADRKLYALRDQTATVASIPLIIASILSKKLATGAAAVVFDVKTGNGAFLPDEADSVALARGLVETSNMLGQRASAVITDMSQPLGRWAGHTAEVSETMACLVGEGPADLMEVVFHLCEEVSRMAGRPLVRTEIEAVVSSGAARECFISAVEAHGGNPAALESPPSLGPDVVSASASRDGYLNGVDTRALGLLLAAAGGGRTRPGEEIDPSIALETCARLGDRVAAGQELARLYARCPGNRLERELAACFVVGEEPVTAPRLIRERFSAASSGRQARSHRLRGTSD
jgi:pyrimidine-nucleoside phosphorylase